MAPNVFCRMTTTSNIQRKILRTAKDIKNYLQRKEERGVLEVMVWPPQSPDLNIIESVWDYVKREKHLRLPKSTEELWLVPQDGWFPQ